MRQHFINWTEKFKSLALPKTIIRRWKSKPKRKPQYRRKCSQCTYQIKVFKFRIYIYFKNLWQNIQRKTIIQKDICTWMFTAALFTTARTWKQPACPSVEERIKKVWHTHTMNGISLSHKMVWNWVICRDMSEPRKCHTGWSKSEREKQIQINTYMSNLEEWYRWSYLQSRNRHRRRERIYIYIYIKGEEGGWEELGDWDLTHIRYGYYV